MVEDGKVSGGSQNGLVECGDMDRQLARVALADMDDVHSGILDEIFQCVYFSELLGIRR